MSDATRWPWCGERRAFVTHFTTFWSAWRPEDFEVDAMSRREQLLDSVGCFDERVDVDGAEPQPRRPAPTPAAEQFALTAPLVRQPNPSRAPRQRRSSRTRQPGQALLGGLA